MREETGTIREEVGKGSVLMMDPNPGVDIVAVHLFMRMGSL